MKRIWKAWRHLGYLARNVRAEVDMWWGDRAWRSRHLELQWRKREGLPIDPVEEWEVEAWE